MNDFADSAPLCFVLMPFGKKMDAAGRLTDFDAVYEQIIAPAVVQAGLEPVRADEEKVGGTIHKPMFERLMLCDSAVADITGANPNVFYELGIRHALRPRSTVIVFREGTVVPFDIALVRGIPYKTDGAGGPLDSESTVASIAAQLMASRANPHDDSPIFQLIEDLPRLDIDRTKTDVFRSTVDYSRRYKERLANAVKQGASAVEAVAAEPGLRNLAEVETGVVVDLFLSLRDVRAYDAMIKLYDRMPPPLRRAKTIREQFGFALNREGRFEEAERILKGVIAEFGPSSETNGLLGRLYKDRWEAAQREGRLEARALLTRAIDTYVQGFEADWRDAYPGVNAVSLMEMMNPPDPRQARILPAVRYSASQKASRDSDYWDYASLLELAVLSRDREDSESQLAEALATARASWETASTERNLRLIRETRTARGEDATWVKSLEDSLAQHSRRLAPRGPDARTAPHMTILHRRSDSEAAERMRERLAAHYGDAAVELHGGAIPISLDGRERFQNTRENGEILLVLMGPNWLGAPEDRRKAILDERDPLCLNIEAALKAGTLVIPVLVAGAEMPERDQLPAAVQGLARRNPARIDTGREFHLDMANLIATIDRELEHESVKRTKQPDIELSVLDEDRRGVLVGLKALARDFFQAGGRPVSDGGHDQLLGPDPIWVCGISDPQPQDFNEFSRYLDEGQRGFLVYQGVLSPNSSTTLDRLRVEGKAIIPINMNAMSAAIADGNAAVLLADLERAYESQDNLFDTRNAIVDERFFFGRSELLAQVGTALTRGEHVLITGLRKCGKTSFLNILRQHLSAHPVCFVDLQRYDRHNEDWPTALFQLILKSYDNWGRRNFRDWPSSNAALAVASTATEFEERLGERVHWQRERGRTERMILILDEAERIFPAESEIEEARKYTRVAGALRVIGQSSDGRTLSIIAADLRPWLNRKNVLPDRSTNPFFNFFQEVPLSLLSQVAVGELVRVIGSAVGVNQVDASYVDELYSLSGGHPSIARMIAGASYKARVKPRELALQDIHSALDEMAATDALGFFIRNNLWGLMTAEERTALRRLVSTSVLRRIESRVQHMLSKERRDPEASANLYSQGILRDGKIAIGVFNDWIREFGEVEG